MELKVINGDNLEILKNYPDNYFDAVVTDPPYGLGKEPDTAQMLSAWLENGYMEVKGSGFMGKEWDAFVPQPIFWKEVFRVLKHGGHVLAFYGTRTYDWGVMAMRLAGFEVRDCIQWVYGSGFPKSHNISKAIDKMYGAEREVVGKSKAGSKERKGHKGDMAIMPFQSETVELNLTAPATDQAKEWEGWGSALKPANEPIVLARKPLEKGLSIAENLLKWGVGGINVDGCRVGFKNEADYKESTQKNQHEDFGTKPMTNNNVYGDYSMVQPKNYEPQGRFPANLILTHHPECECVGTKKVKAISGGTNTPFKNEFFKNIGGGVGSNAGGLGDENGEETIEDWSCHPDCPIRIMDEQSGVLKSGKMTPNHKRTTDGSKNGIYGKFDVNHPLSETYGDKGGASRFFYVAKASKSERNKGLELEKWFYNLELITESCSFTEQNLFIWEQEEQNQSMDLNMEVQQKKDISEGIALLVSDKECCTTLNGKNITGLFPMAIKFTTSTGLSQIIELKTLNYYQHLNINDCIVDVLETNKENGLNLAENVGIKNLLKLIFTKDKMGFPLGVKIVAKKTQQLTNVKDVWGKNNIHSTVKPIKLMQYLVRLVTPPNGIVLDPFCGSGTTGVACKLEGFQFVGLEQDLEYSKIAEARIRNYVEGKETPNPVTEVDKPSIKTKLEQLNLFNEQQHH